MQLDRIYIYTTLSHDKSKFVVLHELGRLPRRGERVDFGGFEFAVTKADKRRIDLLQVQRQGD